MSPRTTAAGRRRLSRTPAYAKRDRREVFEAVGVVLVILAGTGIAIWAMRPGGVAGRQPRALLLGIIAVAVLLVVGRLLVGPGRRFADRARVGWAIALGAAAAFTVVGAALWPGGLMITEEQPLIVPDPLGGEPPPIDADAPELEEPDLPSDPDAPVTDIPPADEPPPAP